MAEHIEAALADVLAFAAFSEEGRRPIRSNTSMERGSTARTVSADTGHGTDCDELTKRMRH